MGHVGYRERSKLNWGTKEGENLTIEQVNCGAILRIADATEKMAHSYVQLIEDRDYYKRRYEEELASGKRMSRQIAALKGHINRMKKEN